MILRLFVRINMLPVKKKQCRKRGNRTQRFSTKLHAIVDTLGNPLFLILTPGQGSDIDQAENLIADYDADAVIADKAYDSNKFIETIEESGAEAVIPSRRNRKEKREIDKNLYKDRNKIERFFNRIKHYRRVATRYDKTARNYLAFVHGALIVTLFV